MYRTSCGLQGVLIRAVRDDTKQIRMKSTVTVNKFQRDIERKEAIYSRMAWTGFPEEGAIESGLEK